MHKFPKMPANGNIYRNAFLTVSLYLALFANFGHQSMHEVLQGTLMTKDNEVFPQMIWSLWLKLIPGNITISIF